METTDIQVNQQTISRSLQQWRTERAAHLDDLEHALIAIDEGTHASPGASVQVGFAYALLLSAQFQGFCRDLHTEVVLHAVQLARSKHGPLADLLHARLVEGRKLDQGNPNPGNIGSDFGRFSISFWNLVEARDARCPAARGALEDVANWRNAIAHNDFTSPRLRGQNSLSLARIRAWRADCNLLAVAFDAVVHDVLLAWWSPIAWDWRS